VKALVILTALAGAAHAEDRVYVRAGVLHMTPLSTSRELELSDVHGPASLAVMNGPIRGSGTTVDPVTTAAVIVGYRLTDRIAVETILATPIHVRFRATGSLAMESIAPTALGIPTGVPALGDQLGEADALPPVVTAVYRLLPGDVVPYAGAGASVLYAYHARATNPILVEAGAPELHIDPAAGLVLQVGLDARIWGRVHARADLKYIAFMTAHATVDHIRVRTPALPLFDPVAVGTATMEVTINPLIVQLGIGVDFW
jgi:outer membrane protein W